MSIFSNLFGGKKKKGGCCDMEIVEESSCCCCGSNDSNTEIVDTSCCDGETNGICCIKVLGTGCKACHNQLENVKKAVKNMRLSIQVEYITDMQEVMEYGVMSTPALVVNEKVVSVGKVLKSADIEKLLHKLELEG